MNRLLQILFFCCCTSIDSYSQNKTDSLPIAAEATSFSVNDLPVSKTTELLCPTVQKTARRDTIRFENFQYHWILFYDFFTTLTAIHYKNSLQTNEPNNLFFYYNIDLKNNLEFKKIKWDLYLFNDYGVRYYFDSIANKSQDQLTFKNSLYYPLFTPKIFFSLSASTQTKLFNSHELRSDSLGTPVKYLYDGFMSPGTILYSGGLTIEPGRNCVIHIGLGSSKVTKIKNQHIFETREESEISGLEKGRKKKYEIGLSLTTTVPIQHLGQHIHWEFFGTLFAPVKQIKSIRAYTADINNVFHILLLRYVRLSLRTKLNFNAEQNPKPLVQNQISLGFFLSNHL